jgi:hypothetical protein
MRIKIKEIKMNNRDLLVNIATITEDSGTFSSDKNYAYLNRGFSRGKGAIAKYDGMMIPLVAIDNGFYFAAEIMGKYILIVIARTGVTCTVKEAATSEGTE